MKNSWKKYWCVLASAVMFVSVFATGCEEESSCYYQCEDGLLGAIDGLEDDGACVEAAEDDCKEANEGDPVKTDFVEECDEDSNDKDGDPCAPDWYSSASVDLVEVIPPLI
ncbi:MAG: hypothetical protein GY854_17535 [Deltaproteobacteria bacterium]|nr:hypothetical protein [Deltaproteobacteria bacterium]